MKNPNIEHLIQILSKFGNKYIDQNGKLKRQNLLADVNNYNKALIQTLASDPKTKQAYFVPINNIYVFKADKFSQAVRDAGYWLKSHTDYENHVGLAIDRHYLKDSSNVVLDFPHKDCVLQGGMTTEDTKNNVHERFYNDVISAPQIDNMFAPKILCNVKKYDQNHLDGKSVTSFNPDTDNLMIKANNLIALKSLIPRYAGKIKSIIIDPPYYFRKKKSTDTFEYNSNFHLSTWLTFMKNRIDIAKQLLSKDGFLVMTMGCDGAAYLKVLTDEIFNVTSHPNRYIGTIAWRKNINQANVGQFANVSDRILLYKKSENTSLGRLPLTKNTIREYRYNDHNGRGFYSRAHHNLIDKTRGRYHYSLKTPYGNILTGPWMKHKNEIKKLNKNHYIYWSTQRGHNPHIKEYLSKNLNKGQIPSDFWNKYYGTNQDGTQEIKDLFNGKKVFSTPKPEKLLQNLISITTNPTDIVLDFFSGSCTTQAVAMKMHRRFIGVEQMNYINTISIPRLQKVIKGEQGGISKAVNWQGGGSFVFATFLNKNQKFIQLVQNAKDSNQLDHIYHQMKDSADIRLDVDLKKYESKADDLPREKKRKCLIDMLDKNQLYYNYADIDDRNVRSMISDSDYHFNKSFYDGGDNK